MTSFDVWCENVGTTFGYVEITSQLKSSVKVVSDTSCGEQPGVDLGEFQATTHDVAGRVFLVNSKTIRIENFVFDGLAPGISLLSAKLG